MAFKEPDLENYEFSLYRPNKVVRFILRYDLISWFVYFIFLLLSVLAVYIFMFLYTFSIGTYFANHPEMIQVLKQFCTQ